MLIKLKAYLGLVNDMQIDITENGDGYKVVFNGKIITEKNKTLSQAVKKLHKYLVGQNL